MPSGRNVRIGIIYIMNRVVQIIVCLLISVMSGSVLAQSAVRENESSTAETEQQQKKQVTAVYGVTADDYLPTQQYSAREYLRPNTRRAVSRPAFDLPDAFYFVGGPIFLLILLRVIATILTGFEEKRKDEENQVASEHFNPE
jgi:hypothetical protein